MPLSVVREILDIARFAPSGGNTQPWHLYVVGGEKQRRVGERGERTGEEWKFRRET